MGFALLVLSLAAAARSGLGLASTWGCSLVAETETLLSSAEPWLVPVVVELHGSLVHKLHGTGCTLSLNSQNCRGGMTVISRISRI